MKTIVIGYDNANGLGDAVVLKGLNVPQAEQVRFVSDAKSTNVFPKGVKHMQFCVLEERITAIEVVRAEVKPETKTETKHKKTP